MTRTTSAGQLALWFEIPTEPEPATGSLDFATELRHTISDAIARSGKTRHEIAAEMSRLTGADITKSMLDAWTAESRAPWRFPFEYSAAFEVATGSYCLVDLLTRKRGCKAYYGREALEMELGKIGKKKLELRDQELKLTRLLKGEGSC